MIRSQSLKIAMYGYSDEYNPFIHGKELVESRIRMVLGDIDFWHPHYVKHTLGIDIPLCESYGNYSPQFEMMILAEAGFVSNFWRKVVDGVEGAGDYLLQKYEDTKEAAKEKVKDFKDATVGLMKKGGALMQTMWAVTAGGGANTWLNALRWQVNRIYKYFKQKFDKFKNYVLSFSWLEFLRKPLEWLWEKITFLKDKTYELSGVKGALMATGAAAGLGIMRQVLGEKMEALIKYVDKALAGAGWDPNKQPDQDGLVQTGAKMIGEKLQKELVKELKDTFVGQIFGWAKDKIESMIASATTSAITGGWGAYKDVLVGAYKSMDAVLNAIGPALKRAGGVGGVAGSVGSLHDLQLENLKSTIESILSEMSFDNLILIESHYAKLCNMR